MSSGNIWYLRADNVFDLHLHKTYVEDDDKPLVFLSVLLLFIFIYYFHVHYSTQ
jgi:hypothetical protein